jgi:hypothetical protein
MDDRILFEGDDTHRYLVDGKEVPRSVTAVLKRVVGGEDFKPDLVIERNLASWRRRPKTEYGAMIVGMDDEAAAAKIKKSWEDANRLGTELHRRMEAYLNDEAYESNEYCTDDEWNKLLGQLHAMHRKRRWTPYRTELSVFYDVSSADGADDGRRVVCAGQIDALFKDEAGNVILVDLKRVKRHLTDTEPFGGATCNPPLQSRWANEFVKYSLQASMYAAMFHQRTGVKIHQDSRYLLQAHPSMNQAVLVRCDCLDNEALQILDSLSPDEDVAP